jgi:hypothetical protein
VGQAMEIRACLDALDGAAQTKAPLAVPTSGSEALPR